MLRTSDWFEAESVRSAELRKGRLLHVRGTHPTHDYRPDTLLAGEQGVGAATVA